MLPKMKTAPINESTGKPPCRARLYFALEYDNHLAPASDVSKPSTPRRAIVFTQYSRSVPSRSAPINFRTCKALDAADGSMSTRSMLPSMLKNDPEVSCSSALRKHGTSRPRDCLTCFQNTSSLAD